MTLYRCSPSTPPVKSAPVYLRESWLTHERLSKNSKSTAVAPQLNIAIWTRAGRIPRLRLVDWRAGCGTWRYRA